MSAWGNLIDPEHHVCYYLSSLIETYWHTRKSSLHLCSTDFKFFSLYCIPKYQLFISRELKIYPKYPSLIDFKHFRTSLNVWKIDHGHEVQYIYRLGEKVTGVKQSERSVQKVSLSGWYTFVRQGVMVTPAYTVFILGTWICRHTDVRQILRDSCTEKGWFFNPCNWGFIEVNSPSLPNFLGAIQFRTAN